MAIDPTVVAWVNQEAAALAHRGLTPGSPREADLLAHWHHHRPKMLHQLKAAGIAQKMALVLDQKRWEAKLAYIGNAPGGRGTGGDEGVAPDGAGGRKPQPAAIRPNFHIDGPERSAASFMASVMRYPPG
jgi:hypothetical protein